jgi:hypothetical protein
LGDPEAHRAANFRYIILNMAHLNHNGINADYVLNEIHSFNNGQAWKAAIYEAAKMAYQARFDTTKLATIFTGVIRETSDNHSDCGLSLGDLDHLLAYVRHHDQRVPHRHRAASTQNHECVTGGRSWLCDSNDSSFLPSP